MFFNLEQEYKSALRYTNRLLQIEPQNRQGIELQEKITAQMKKGKSNCIAHSIEKKVALRDLNPLAMQMMFMRLNGSQHVDINKASSRCLGAG